jgi:hypothetical protein
MRLTSLIFYRGQLTFRKTPSHSHKLKRKYSRHDEHKAPENEMEWSDIELETGEVQQVRENY